MTRFDFAVMIEASKMSHEEILDATDALGEAGCTDASFCEHAKGMELQFTRSALGFFVAAPLVLSEIKTGARARKR